MTEPLPERATLVDSNVLIDVFSRDEKWLAWSTEALERAADFGPLVINPIIYGEVSIGFSRVEEVESALSEDFFVRLPLPWSAAFLAGKAFVRHRQHGGGKRSPLPDFLIGAHAAVSRFRLLTRDCARYRSYFPTVELISPDT
jgi:predicted nucleic acid-binding protein